MLEKRLSVNVMGIVQGVGFRPFVYRLAEKLDLAGFVKNSPNGVQIEIEGPVPRLEAFLKELEEEPPSRSSVDRVVSKTISPLRDSSPGRQPFAILKSGAATQATVPIPPDFAICRDCVDEFEDPKNRRHRYPLINCTNCGPRFSIITGRPFDRTNTTMAAFELCAECQDEYDTPNSRRFHAEAISCKKCGPRLSLYRAASAEDPIEAASRLIGEGKIVAIKGIGGYNLACNAHSRETVARLREIKNRPTRALALMAPDEDVVRRYCRLSSEELAELKSPVAPITLLRRKQGAELQWIAPNNNYLGFMLPYTAIHKILLESLDVLVMTSANYRNEPIAITERQIFALCDKGICDEVLWHNRRIANRLDDSITGLPANHRQLIRRSRGIVPAAIPAAGPNNPKPCLALGANLKNTVAFSEGGDILLSQHLGDLEDERNLVFQSQSVASLKSLFQLDPQANLEDLHPGFGDEGRGIQHHEAHFMSVIAEHDLWQDEVLGVIADGTGYGRDASIWGFEFFRFNGVDAPSHAAIERLGTLQGFPLAGGTQAIAEVDRIGIALTRHCTSALPFDAERWALIRAVIDSGVNTPTCHSLGRLFDGIAAILGFVGPTTYEGEAAEWLQKLAEDHEEVYGAQGELPYDVTWRMQEPAKLSYDHLIESIVQELEAGKSPGLIAWRFHAWVVQAMVEKIRAAGARKVAFSGGCFQNRLLMTILRGKEQEQQEFQFFFNRQVPANDGGISFGQAAMAQLRG